VIIMETESVEWYPVSEQDQIPLREGKRVIFDKYDVALFNLGEGVFMAVDSRCPHKQGPLADGMVSGTSVFCPLHTLKISLETGCSLNGGEGKVKKYPVKIIDNQVCIAFKQGKKLEE